MFFLVVLIADRGHKTYSGKRYENRVASREKEAEKRRGGEPVKGKRGLLRFSGSSSSY
jgi:hypothetical protein